MSRLPAQENERSVAVRVCPVTCEHNDTSKDWLHLQMSAHREPSDKMGGWSHMLTHRQDSLLRLGLCALGVKSRLNQKHQGESGLLLNYSRNRHS